MAEYINGDTWRTRCRFTVTDLTATPITATLTDPSTVTLKVQDPAGTETSYTLAGATVTKDSTGNYHKDVTINLAGRWVARWIGTGTVPTAVERIIYVPTSNFTTP